MMNRILQLLEERRVPFDRVHHRATYTAQETAQLAHVSGNDFAKAIAVLLDGKPALAVVPASLRVDLDRLRLATGAYRVELAPESTFARWFPDSEPGAEPPFGSLYDIPTWVDSMLADDVIIAFNGGTHEDTLRITFDDYLRLERPTIASFAVGPEEARGASGWH